jgi:hypothetical protein
MTIEFGAPTPGERNKGLVTATLLDWAICIDNILGLAGEMAVRKEFGDMLRRILKAEKTADPA